MLEGILPGAEPVKILCVDDQEANLTSLEAALDGTGYKIICVRSGAEALAHLQEEEFAVILLDVQMPIMDGFQTARMIRKIERSRTTPVIFLTANYPSEHYALQGYEAGAVDYIFKPLNIDVLRAKVAVFVDLFKTKVDIKLLRKAEAELRKAVQIRDEFLSIASHELKTPITPLQLQMQGFMRMIETGRLETTSVEKLKYMLEISSSQVTRLSRFIDQLLDVSRLNEGRLSIQCEQARLSDIIRSVLEQLQHEIESSDCSVQLRLDDSIAGKWDRLRIEQVVVNLLTNAMKYAAGRPIQISTMHTDDNAVMMVRDQGIGIAKADHERIFGCYERAVPVANYGGLGLGLYISRQIVELHQGRIWVESEPGKGACFFVELPLSSKSGSFIILP